MNNLLVVGKEKESELEKFFFRCASLVGHVPPGVVDTTERRDIDGCGPFNIRFGAVIAF